MFISTMYLCINFIIITTDIYNSFRRHYNSIFHNSRSWTTAFQYQIPKDLRSLSIYRTVESASEFLNFVLQFLIEFSSLGTINWSAYNPPNLSQKFLDTFFYVCCPYPYKIVSCIQSRILFSSESFGFENNFN